MIFLMLGSSVDAFDRLVGTMDALAPSLGEDVVIQCGRYPYPGRHARCLGYLAFDEVQVLVQQCRLMIGHGSTGPVLMARRYGKPLVIVPRDPAFHESFNDHQLQLAKAMEGRSRMVEVVYDIKDLEAAVRRAQAKADQGLTYEPFPERERLLRALRATVEGREIPPP